MPGRIARAAAGAALLTSALLPAAISAAPASASTPSDGWIRLAHLSPNTPPVDVYLYPFGDSTAETVLPHVAYGTVSGYEALKPGLYLVAMRAAGAGSTTPPVISTQVDVTADHAYTVAGLGPASALDLDVLADELTVPEGRAGVRIIEASLLTPQVTITAGGIQLAANLRFPAVTGYQNVAPGTVTVQVSAAGSTASSQLALAAESTHTLAVVNGTGATPKILDLGDAAGAVTMPVGGVQTGFGGTAGHPATAAAESPAHGVTLLQAAWAAALAAGLAGAGWSVVRLRRR